MRRSTLALGGGCCLVLAGLLYPAPDAPDEGVLAALGRSMGGSRVMAIDALFLRAEAQRKAGRIEDAAALYQTVLDLDPANEAATIFLVNVYVDQLMPQVPDADERYAWWLEARRLLDTALARRPGSASLHARAGGLILDARHPGGALADRPEAEEVAETRVALAHLGRAAAAAGTLPRLGRVHLLQMSWLAPEVAAEALRADDAEALGAALEAGAEALSKRRAILETMRLDDGDESSLARLLQAGLAAVQAVDAARRGTGSPAAAREAVEAARALLPEWPAVRILDGLVPP